MTILPKGDWSIAGTWVPCPRDDGTDGAIVLCPKCGRGAVTAAQIQEVESYHGLIEVELPCPQLDCTFKDTLKLMWWKRGGQ